MPGSRSRPWVKVTAVVLHCDPAATFDRGNDFSVTETGAGKFSVTCKFEVEKKSRQFAFLSSVPYKVGEAFEMEASPDYPSHNSLEPTKPHSVWLQIALSIAWLCISNYLLRACGGKLHH